MLLKTAAGCDSDSAAARILGPCAHTRLLDAFTRCQDLVGRSEGKQQNFGFPDSETPPYGHGLESTERQHAKNEQELASQLLKDSFPHTVTPKK